MLYTGIVVDKEEIYEALNNVIDPELGLGFVDLGLIYELDVDESGAVEIVYTLTSPACPISEMVEDMMRDKVEEVEGVKNIKATLTFDPPWNVDLMSDDAKFSFGF